MATKHGHNRDGLRSKEYECWHMVIQRCENPKASGYYRYGGRGIKICPRWRGSFAAFFEDMGPKPTPNHSIDRINSDGDYEPGNCRWATRKEQSRNREGVKLPEESAKEIRAACAAGMSQSEAGRRWGVHGSVVCRLVNGRIWL